MPVLIVHGGPGGASRPEPLRWFEELPVRWIVLDQRGCGRSQPVGATVANGLGDLLDDMERLRGMLGLARWAVAAGSWGARVALSYAERHPERLNGLFLRSPFLGSLAETRRYIAPWSNWLGSIGRQALGSDAAQAVHSLYHEGTESFIVGSGLARDEWLAADAVVAACGAYDDAQAVAGGVAVSGARWSPSSAPLTDAQRSTWAVHCHYAKAGWGERDGWPRGLPRGLRLSGTAAAVVWGEADATCDPAVASSLVEALGSAGLAVQADAVAGAGHRMGDPRLMPVLREATQRWVARLQP